jgi:hypothetical protein
MQTLRVSLFTLLLLAPAAVGPEVQAQEEGEDNGYVVCTSIIYTISPPTATAYVDTELDGDAPLYYSAVTTGDFNGSSDIGSEGLMSISTGAGTYNLTAWHSLYPNGTVVVGGIQYYQDSLDFTDAVAEPPCDPCLQSETAYGYGPEKNILSGEIDLFTTYDAAYSNPPHISSVGPPSLTLGSSGGSLLIMGSGLTFGGVDENPTVAVASRPSGVAQGAGLTVSSTPSSATDSQIIVPYGVDSNPGSVGTYAVTVTANGVVSNAYPVTVGDATPVIGTITTNGPDLTDFQVGTTITFTITGSNFGTSPAVNITGPGITSSSYGISSSPAPSNTSITGWITAPSAGTASVTVTSQGYNGNSFVQSGGDSPTSNPAEVAIDQAPAPPPAPTIVWTQAQANSTCTGASIGPTQNVVVGQRIAFSACAQGNVQWQAWGPASPPGTTAASNNPGQDYTPGQVPPAAVATAVCAAGAECDFNPFYWIDQDQAGDRKFTITYTAADGEVSQQATITFKVSGPTGTGPNGAFFNAPLGNVAVDPPLTASMGNWANSRLEFGNEASPGITFNVTANNPANGSFQWVQTITSGARQYVENTNPAQSKFPFTTGLDNWYPYAPALGPDGNPVPTTAVDYPGADLVLSNGAAVGEVATTFAAQMYLMWDPALPGPGQNNCHAAFSVPNLATGNVTSTPSTCAGSIPVTLGFMNWGFNGDAINTMTNQLNPANPPNQQTTWLKNCGSPNPAAPAFQQSSSYPTWTNVFHNN